MTTKVAQILAVATGLWLASLVSVEAQASDAEPGVEVYTPATFAEFLPRTALDLVRQLPGFGLNGGDDVRGLSGAQGNALINGRRPPRGSGSLEGRIRAIRVEDVIRLELIEPGARDVDMQGYPLLLNIVTRSTSAARIDGRIEIEPREDGGEEYQGELTTGWSSGPLELEARIDLYDETLTDYAAIRSSTADSPFARASVDELEGRTRRDWQALARLAVNANNDLELTVSSERNDDFSRPTPASAAEVGAIEDGRDEAIERFGSARWRHAFTDRIDLIGLVTQRQGEATSRDSLISGGIVSESASSRETGETAARADMRWRPMDTLAVETGLTWASNTLEGSSSASIDGVVQSVDGDDAEVEETRSAILASATWTPNSRVSATVGGRVEQFSLDSSNEGGASLSLTDLAPRADLNWALPDDWTLRLSTERRVGQLDLGLFLASTDLDNALSTAGASTLEPPRDWVHQITLERRFGERDLVRIEGETVRSDNPVSSILDTDGEVRPANISAETVTRVTADFELELDRFGFVGLSLDGRATHRWSDRVDQLQGFSRTTSGHRDYFYRIGLRKEWAGGRYVLSARLEERAPAMHFWLTEIRKEDNGLNVNLDGEWRHSPLWRTGLATRWQEARTDVIYVFDGVRRPGVGPVLVNTLERSEGVYVNLWSEWEARPSTFIRLSLRSGRDRSGTSRVDTPQGVFRDQLSRSSDNVPSFNVRLRFQR